MVRVCKVCKKEERSSDTDTSYHKFPEDEHKRNAWLKALGLSFASKTAVICSDHFLADDFHYNPDPVRRRRKKGSVPSRNLIGSSRQNIGHNENTEIVSHALTNSLENAFPTSGSQQSPLVDIQILQDRTNVNHTVSIPSALQPWTAGLSRLSKARLFEHDKVSTSTFDGPDEGQHFFSNIDQATVQNSAFIENVENDQLSLRLPLNTYSISNNNAHLQMNTDSCVIVKATDENKRLSEDCTLNDESPRKKCRSVCGHTPDNDISSEKVDKKRSSNDAAISSNSLNDKKFHFLHEYIENERKSKKNMQRNNRSLKVSIKNCKELKSTLRNKNILSTKAEECIKTLPAGVQNLLTSILQGKKYKKYPDALRNFALNLHFYSPRAYLFLKENFGDLLRGLTTLRNYLRQYNFEPGVSIEALECAKRLIADGKTKKKNILFNLVCDEMSIRQRPEWDASAKKMVGYVDYGSSKTPLDDEAHSSLASSAMVFMLVALNSHFKIPLATYFVKTLDSDDKSILLSEVLDAYLQNNIDIKNLTFDGVSSNIKMAENLGAELKGSTSEVFFDYTSGTKTKRLRVTLDTCHALKLVRNTLDKHDITDKNGRIISFKYIRALQKLQETEEMHAATKLRRRHIHFKNDVMKVNVAAQTLSSSVANALDFCREDLELDNFKDSAATSEFCRNVDEAFDILNSRNIYNKYPKKHGISRKNLKHIKTRVNELVEYFESLQINDTPILKTQQHTGFLGLITGLKNAVAIAEELFATFSNFDFLLTYKLSQDHLETFFSCIRRLGEFNNNPTLLQYKGAFRKLMAHVTVNVPLSANCMPRDDTILKIVDDSEKKSKEQEDSGISPSELNSIFDLLDEVNLSRYNHDVGAYISGSVVRLVKKKIACKVCSAQLEMEKDEEGNYKNMPVSKLQTRKCYGKLISASQDVIEICRTAEKIFRLQISFAEKNVLEKMVLKTVHVLPNTIFSQSNHIFEQEVLSDHRSQLIRLIIEQYLHIKLHYAAGTEDEKKERIRQRLQKFILFQGK